MNVVATTVSNCRTASIRKAPWIPHYKFHEEADVICEKRRGDEIKIDLDRVCYDWQDRKFYRTVWPKGWIHEGVVDVGGEANEL